MKKGVLRSLKAAEAVSAPEHTGGPKLVESPVGKRMRDPMLGGCVFSSWGTSKREEDRDFD